MDFSVFQNESASDPTRRTRDLASQHHFPPNRSETRTDSILVQEKKRRGRFGFYGTTAYEKVSVEPVVLKKLPSPLTNRLANTK